MTDHNPAGIEAQIHRSMRLNDWIRISRGPVTITALTSLSTFLALILLYRQLSPDEAGILTLFLAIVPVLVMISGLGQPTLILRIYSRASEMDPDWPKDLTTTVMLSIPIMVLICSLAMLIYEFRLLHISLAFITGVLQLVLLIGAQMLNSSRNYKWGNTILRLPNSLLIVPASLLVLLDFNSQIDVVLALYTFLTALVAILGFYLLWKKLKRGRREIMWKQRTQGAIFLLTQSAYTLPEEGNVSIAGGILPVAKLAVYGSAAVILKPFDLLAGVLRTIVTSELIRDPGQKRSALNLGLWGLGLLGLILTLFLGPPLFNLVYEDRYAEGLALIPWLAGAGLFRIVEILPRSYIIGNARQPDLRSFVIWQAILAIGTLAVGAVMISVSGVSAVAWTIFFIQSGRYAVSLVAFRKILVQEVQSVDL